MAVGLGYISHGSTMLMEELSLKLQLSYCCGLDDVEIHVVQPILQGGIIRGRVII